MLSQNTKQLAFASIVAVATAKTCQNITIPVTISARNGVFNLAAPATNIEASNFVLNNIRQGHNYTQEVLNGYATVSGTYNLAATYCVPDSGPSNTLQILTHGIGFDRSYWDVPFDNGNYSYVNSAVDEHSYSTLAYDRLGLGQSSHGDPVDEIQSSLEIAALGALTSAVRAGCLSLNHTFDRVVHVGHSFGSIISYSFAQRMPNASDGLVLTGFSQNATFMPVFASGGDFVVANTMAALAEYPAGYLATGSKSGIQEQFFAPGSFDPAILNYTFATLGRPVTVGELLTTAGGTGQGSTFGGPVLIITGERDLPFCGGDCYATGNPSVGSILDASKRALPKASAFETVVVPGAGHGLNLEYSHSFTYSRIADFLSGNVK